jgi:sporulation protein YlmC with PRC-barrel domain
VNHREVKGAIEMRLSDETLRGRTVIAADGRAVGEVSALFLDSDAWSVESVQVKLRKDVADQLGASRTMFHAGTVEIPTRLIQSVGDAVVLAVPVDGLREVLPGEGEPASAH